MDWQQPASLAVVAVTGFLFIRHEIRQKRKARARGCGSDCGCGTGDEARRAAEPTQRHTGGEPGGNDAPY
jgi:hypothetical protein